MKSKNFIFLLLTLLSGCREETHVERAQREVKELQKEYQKVMREDQQETNRR